MTATEYQALESLRLHHQLSALELARALWPTSVKWGIQRPGMAGAAGKLLHRLKRLKLVESSKQEKMMRGGGNPPVLWSLTGAGVEALMVGKGTRE